MQSLRFEVSEGSRVLLMWTGSLLCGSVARMPHVWKNIGSRSELVVYPKESIRVNLGRHRLAFDRNALHQRKPSCSCIWNNYHRVGVVYLEEGGVKALTIVGRRNQNPKRGFLNATFNSCPVPERQPL